MSNSKRFNIDEYTDTKYAMVCENEYEDESFRRHLDSVGRKWNSGDSYLELSYYRSGNIIAYFFNQNMYDNGRDRDKAISEGWALYYKDFRWDSNLDNIDPSDVEVLENFLEQFEVK